jgi:hypothetical protein
MPDGVRIHLYGLCRNDARLLPYFFRHYDRIVDEFVIFDFASKDGSADLLRRDGRVRVEPLEVVGNSVVDEQRRLFDRAWQRSRGRADWVILADVDELVHRPDLVAYLVRCRMDGITAIEALGYEMVADAFPAGDEALTRLVTRGCRSVGHNRLCIFNPDAISATHFGPGRSRAWPEGHVVWPPSPEVLLLHYRQLGVDYVLARNAHLAPLLKPGDMENGWGAEARWGRGRVAEHARQMAAQAVTVPGLGELQGVPPEEYRGDERIVEQSGLLDGDWYLAANEDLANSLADPLTHFCNYGWREGRQPNFYFDPTWYRATYPQAAVDAGNPLVHYVLEGEHRGNQPSPHFDTGWYRERHGLGPEESPLRHYLLRRGSGKVSPLPGFDVEAFCRSHPEVPAAGRDPYEAHVEEQRAGGQAMSRYPAFAGVVRKLGLDPSSDVYPAQVPWSQVLDVVRYFVQRYPFDEAWYRAAYPDVDTAIRQGQIASAHRHFLEHGYFEGRGFGPE